MNYEVATFRTIQLPRDIEQFEKEITRIYTLNLLEKQKTRELDDTGKLHSVGSAGLHAKLNRLTKTNVKHY